MNKLYLNLFNKIDFDKIIDHPNILIAAAFWEEDRYRAARTCYKYMRAIDDLIDCHKSVHAGIGENERKEFTDKVHTWISMARESSLDNQDDHELLNTIRRFHIPLWPLEAFAKSMIFDIDHTGFRTVNEFLVYSQGASVAPASIFVHLNGLTREGNEYTPPAFDVRAAATPCAVFSYLVHIIRDFQKDQLNNLNYFADDVIAKNGLTKEALRGIAEGGHIPAGFRHMIREYYDLADQYRETTYRVIERIFPFHDPRYRLSLQIIFNLYMMVFERIDIENGTFTSKELNPTPQEIKERVYTTIENFRED
jgi:phytoene/squalene synthetase